MDQQEQFYQWELLVVTEMFRMVTQKSVVCFTGATIQWSAVYQSRMLARTDKSVMIGTESV
jgi:uncharacterized membrane protein